MKNLTVITIDDSGNYNFKNTPANVKIQLLDMGLDVPLHHKSESTNIYDRFLSTKKQLEYESTVVKRWFVKEIKILLKNIKTPKDFYYYSFKEHLIIIDKHFKITISIYPEKQAEIISLHKDEIITWIKKLPKKKKI